MKHIKTIENLYIKALKAYDNFESEGSPYEAEAHGTAIINGVYWTTGEREQKYKVEITQHSIKLWHWGTETIHINRYDNSIVSFYGQSNSDRDSLNTLCHIVGIDPAFRYFPSIDKFFYDNKEVA